MRSKFEQNVANRLGDLVEYEPERLPFTQPEIKRNYIPDFRYRDNHSLYIECKGRFLYPDRQKLLWVKEQHPDKTIRLLFQNASIKLSKGSKTTYGDWATKNGFDWCDYRRGIPEEWFNTK